MPLPVDYISRLPVTDSAVWAFPRRVVLLGSTGSIGVSALKVIFEHPELFEVVGLACSRNTDLLAEQARICRPKFLAVRDESAAKDVQSRLPGYYRPEILTGQEGYMTLASLDQAGLVVSAQAGAAGLPGTFAAARSGKIIALANKESLVMAGALIRKICRESGAVILPVDSEHNALFQLLSGQTAPPLKLVLTASGGPFRSQSPEFLATVTPGQTLRHPTWSMGPKICVDSASLMNKGLEVIEACHLFGVEPADIDVIIHPQSLVHALAEFADGSTLAHLAQPDMRVPISYCLTYPDRPALPLPRLDLCSLASLTFEAPDHKTFPCLGLAVQAFNMGQDWTVVLNAANEQAVAMFLAGQLAFTDIPKIIQQAFEQHRPSTPDSLEEILELDARTRASITG